MARKKRASMREGPLADLFRSTVDPEDPPEPPPAPGRDEPTGEAETTVHREELATRLRLRTTSGRAGAPESDPLSPPVPEAYEGSDPASSAPERPEYERESSPARARRSQAPAAKERL